MGVRAAASVLSAAAAPIRWVVSRGRARGDLIARWEGSDE